MVIAEYFQRCLAGLSWLPWLSPLSTIRINSRVVRILRLLGEGGFSYVHLVVDNATGEQFALKKIRCTSGMISSQEALKEVAASKKFVHPTIIRVIDHAIVQEPDGTSSVYLLLPYYRSGNLQELIDASVVQGTQLSRRQILAFAKDICIALTHVHQDLVDKHSSDDFVRDFDDAQETSKLIVDNLDSQVDAQETVPYAHFDLKPANLMLGEGQQLVLMDFGSCKPARKQVTSRLEALSIQDEAAEHSTMSYRAPELFDCPTNGYIDEKVDIWSFGCVVFALLYGHSPFETAQTQSGSPALAVLNCQYVFPAEVASGLEHDLQAIIRSCLVLNSTLRPTARELEAGLSRLQGSDTSE